MTAGLTVMRSNASMMIKCSAGRYCQRQGICGKEGAGLSRALLDKVASVFSAPIPGQTESLNIAAAACPFERVRQLG